MRNDLDIGVDDMRLAIAIGAITSLLMIAPVSTAQADQCPPDSGKYCPAGTVCCGNDKCCKEDYAPKPKPSPAPPSPTSDKCKWCVCTGGTVKPECQDCCN